MNVRQLLLRLMLAAVVACCAVVMVAIILDRFDDTATKLLGSAIVLALGSLFAMASLAGWQHPRARSFARVCLAATGFAVTGLVLAIWKDPGETAWQLVFTAITFAVGTAHLLIIAQTNLAPRYRWTWPAVLGCDALITALTLAAAWSHRPSDSLLQLLAALVVAGSGLTFSVAVFHRLSRFVAGPTGSAPAVVCFCPGCGKALFYPAGEIRCHHCDRSFFVEARLRADPPLAVAVMHSSR
jgi:hypothetical protein